MIDQHPINPPPELVEQWRNSAPVDCVPLSYSYHIAAQAARWGADQELDACCERLDRRLFGRDEIAELRAARRPKPPSLKEVALEDLRSIELLQKEHKMVACTFNIRRALEALPND